MKNFRKTIIFYILITAAFCITGCKEKSSMETKTAASEKGYHLSVDSEEEQEAESECKEMMENIESIYQESEQEEDSAITTISDETAEKMMKKLKKSGYPILDYHIYANMYHYKKVESFLSNSANGKAGKVIVYQLHSNGGLERRKFIFDGTDMYLLYTDCSWNQKKESVVNTISYTRIKKWEYTKKGWFSYELCEPEPPEVSEVINGNCMVRVKPLKEEYREFAEKYLLPIAYQGNNLLCSNWDAEHMEELDYNALYEYLYAITYHKKIGAKQYADGIPKAEFEAVMMQYLPVTEEELQKYAVFDQENQSYTWNRLGCLTYSPNSFGTSIPEVTNITENQDGTTSITVDAVCEDERNDAIMSHVVTVQVKADEIKYISNQILRDGLEKIPQYQYRLK